MSEINSITSLPQQTATITQSLQEQDLGRDAFLKLLTVQLQNQDPMDPVKNEAFVAQLSQFSSLEQLQQINKAVSKGGDEQALANLKQSIDGNTAVAMIGREVEIPIDEASYSGDGNVHLGYHLFGPANRVDVQIYDETGRLVRTLTEFSPDEGNGKLVWDGKNDNGQTMPAGVYQIVPQAVNGEGNAVAVLAQLKGKVTGVRYENGQPLVIMDGGEAPLSGIGRVMQTE